MNSYKFYKIEHEISSDDINKFNFENQRIGVIAHIQNADGKILLQQRGAKSRDENGLFEDVGGAVENSDVDFKSAIIREIEEEMGNEANLEFQDCLGIWHAYKNNINWIFVVYDIKYIDGNIKIMEPEKCMGYKFFSQEELMSSDLVSESSRCLCKEIWLN